MILAFSRFCSILFHSTITIQVILMANSVLFLGTSHGDPSLTRFCSSAYYKFGGTSLLVDVGEPARALLIRQNIVIQDLSAVLISHLHGDHTFGVCDVIKHIQKYRVEGRHTDFYFPEAGFIPALENFMAAVHIPINPEQVSLKSYDQTLDLNLNGVHVTCIPTQHMAAWSAPSYSFVFEYNGCRVLHTGDLSANFGDFPVCETDAPYDLCVCEATHFYNNMDAVVAKLAKMPIKKLVFNHIGPHWTDGNEGNLEAAVSGLPYPVILAYDSLNVEF